MFNCCCKKLKIVFNFDHFVLKNLWLGGGGVSFEKYYDGKRKYQYNEDDFFT